MYLLAPTCTLVMELGGDLPGSGYDQLDISGLATLNGTLDLSMLNSYSFDPSKSYEIINGPTTGQFAEVSGLPNGWQVTYAADSVSLVSAVPEPSAFALLAAGALFNRRLELRRKVLDELLLQAWVEQVLGDCGDKLLFQPVSPDGHLIGAGDATTMVRAAITNLRWLSSNMTLNLPPQSPQVMSPLNKYVRLASERLKPPWRRP